MKLFTDVEGDTSTTRIFECCIIITIILLSFVSVITGKDIGSNISNMLTYIALGCEAKKATEYVSVRKK
ncbi:MAG: hypothetical protein Ta2D_08520 [Rickettsiales bacterium]|nr:MAG: hypothetical protein Ta2D_04590 [Rickettsiales bacterium]GMO62203.1 MAG: hypothetical protein Ta2D_08520 [Rickettsiales bacterium]